MPPLQPLCIVRPFLRRLRTGALSIARGKGSVSDVGYQFVDCRWELTDREAGRRQYLAGHIPAASFLDVDEDLSDLSVPDAGRHPLPSAEKFAAAAGRAGIGTGVFVVAYGAAGGREGRLYPGSWSEWSKRRLPLERG